MKALLTTLTLLGVFVAGCGKGESEPKTVGKTPGGPTPPKSAGGPPTPGATTSSAEALAIVDAAIQAQGGEEQLKKLRKARIKGSGKGAFVPGQPETSFTVEDIYEMPDKYKSTMTFELPGGPVSQTQAVNGDAGWIVMNGMSQAMPAAALAEFKEQRYAEDLERLLDLKKPGLTLEVIDDPADVGGKPTLGIKVSSRGHRDVELYFDEQTHLLAKRKHPVLDPASGKQVVLEAVYSDHADVGGVKHWKEVVAYRGGKKLLEGVVTEVELLESVDPAEFAMP